MKNQEFEPIQLGDRVRDPITKFEGIATCITVWLHGCIRMGVQPEELGKDGKAPEARYFDQSQLTVVKKRVHAPVVLSVQPAPEPLKVRGNGGPPRETAGFRR